MMMMEYGEIREDWLTNKFFKWKGLKNISMGLGWLLYPKKENSNNEDG